MNDPIWAAADSLFKSKRLIVDRPKGSKHPGHPNVEYPLDYGYLEHTASGDRAGIDIWVGSLTTESVTALVCTIDLAKSDAEVKLLVGCTPQEEDIILAFHNAGSQTATLVRRHSA
jgi:inorganic pyrophosphatase